MESTIHYTLRSMGVIDQSQTPEHMYSCMDQSIIIPIYIVFRSRAALSERTTSHKLHCLTLVRAEPQEETTLLFYCLLLNPEKRLANLDHSNCRYKDETEVLGKYIYIYIYICISALDPHPYDWL